MLITKEMVKYVGMNVVDVDAVQCALNKVVKETLPESSEDWWAVISSDGKVTTVDSIPFNCCAEVTFNYFCAVWDMNLDGDDVSSMLSSIIPSNGTDTAVGDCEWLALDVQSDEPVMELNNFLKQAADSNGTDISAIDAVVTIKFYTDENVIRIHAHWN